MASSSRSSQATHAVLGEEEGTRKGKRIMLEVLGEEEGTRKGKRIMLEGDGAKPMSNNTPPIKYDVFVNFRGEDVRDTFLSHLTKAFTGKQIHPFVDDKLERGRSIWPSLVEAIEGSFISLIIFSENYASSHWCLEELVKILECKEKYGQIVIPIFYKVDPSVVGNQREKYENALTELEGKHGVPMVQIWRQALNTSAKLSGFTSLNRNDDDLLEEITNCVLKSMPKYQVNRSGLIGMEKQTAILESLLCKESKEARVIGIWGMGGIGKTTIAEETFNRKCSEYEGSCFVEKVKDQKDGMKAMKENIFSTLLGKKVKIDTPNGLSIYIKRRVGRMKVLIVLDDVDDTDEVENIFGTLDWLHSGSRIILTTRDRQVLISNKAEDIHQVEELSSSEALELFNLNAFNRIHPGMVYCDLSQRVVNYAKGIPLVLKVLGRLLCGKDTEIWESQLDKLKKLPIKKVHDVMRLSYDALDCKEQKILLDIACFFNGLKMVVSQLKMLLKDHENDNSVAVGLERLKDRALMTISEDNVVSMHEIIQEMGRELVRRESDDPGSRSRLCDHDDIHEVLENNKGTEAIRSIMINYSLFRNLKLSPYVFAKMSKLQFLEIQEEAHVKCFENFLQGVKVWPTNLKYFSWIGCPLKSLPECFSAESLVMLQLSGGCMQRLWHGVLNLVNLYEVDLSDCNFLEELPDFSKAINLEYLDVCDCVKLKSVHPSIYSLNKLQSLVLRGCVSLTEFTSDTPSRSLCKPVLNDCTSLRKLSPRNIIKLYMEGISANELPSSFAFLSKLEKLDLGETQYKSLPSSINNLTRLQYLYLDSCAELESIPVLPPSLEYIYVGECDSLKTVLFPKTAAEQLKENRKEVLLFNCWNLDESSLRGIELNAQINLMKLTHQHPSDQVDKYENDFDQAVYEYPGSCVPKWIEYKTTKDVMVIDLYGAAPLLGFIFCFILAEEEDPTDYRGQVKFEITINDGDGKKGYYVIDSWISTDNVFLIYDKKCSHYLSSATKNQTRFKIKVAILEAESQGGRMMNWKLRQFGVSPINTLIYNSFIEERKYFDNNN